MLEFAYDKSKESSYFKEQHKREVLWQIWLPVGFGAIAMLALGLLSAFSLQSGADASIRWGHIASIWLILPVFVTGLFVFFFLIGVIIAVGKIASILPHYAEIIQMYMQLVSKNTDFADKSVQTR